jgi:PRC-barrel domain
MPSSRTVCITLAKTKNAIWPDAVRVRFPAAHGVTVFPSGNFSIPTVRVQVPTTCYNRQGERLGTVHNFMVDKSTGQVAYAVMSFGGFLGMGESYHPLPWRVLNYDTRQGGFVIDVDRSRLEKAPSYMASKVPNWSDRTYGSRIGQFYGVPPYWI